MRSGGYRDADVGAANSEIELAMPSVTGVRCQRPSPIHVEGGGQALELLVREKSVCPALDQERDFCVRSMLTLSERALGDRISSRDDSVPAERPQRLGLRQLSGGLSRGQQLGGFGRVQIGGT